MGRKSRLKRERKEGSSLVPSHVRENLKNKLKTFARPGMEIRMETDAGSGMSDLLSEFVAPEWDMLSSRDAPIEEFKMLLHFAVCGWNIALFPEEKRAAQIGAILQALTQDAPFLEQAELRQGALENLELFILRKVASFAEHRRYIMAFELSPGQGDENDFLLNVVSSPAVPDTFGMD